jgi:glycosyltransferase involved in cell wall biosynthesis
LAERGLRNEVVITGHPNADRAHTSEAAYRARGVIARIDPDMPHMHQRRTPAGTIALAKLLRRENAAQSLIHYGTLNIPVLDVLAARMAGVRLIAVMHHLNELQSLTATRRRLTATGSRFCKSIVVSTDRMLSTYRAMGVPEKQLHLIHPGVRPPTSLLDKLEARERLGLPAAARVVAHVARMEPEKGGMDLLQAAADIAPSLTDMQLVFAGDGSALPHMRAFADSRLPGRCHFLGEVGSERVFEVFAASDVHVLPSHAEGFGLVFVEAALAGVPSIGTNVGGIPGVIEHDVSGMLIPPCQPDHLAAAMRRMIGDEEARVRMGRVARGRARDHYSVEQMAAAYISLFST